MLLAFPAKGEAWVGALDLGGPDAAEAGDGEPRNRDAIAVDVGPSEESWSPSRTLPSEATAVHNRDTAVHAAVDFCTSTC